MPPSSRSSLHNSSSSSGPATMVAALMDQTVQKQNAFRDHVGGNHAHAKMAAMRLAIGGQLERLLHSLGPDVVGDSHQVQDFLETQRNRLRDVAALNADNERSVAAFLGAVQQVKRDELHKASSAQSGGAGSSSEGGAQPDQADGDATATDYVEVLQKCMEEQRKKNSDSAEEQANKYVREVLIELKVEKEKVDEDGEIELVDTEDGGNTQGASLRCPITSTMLEEPYRNTVCGHVYSKEAIFEYIRRQRAGRRRCMCPTAGCGNTDVTEQQLERDKMAEIALNRERRRLDKLLQDRASQASQIDSDDEEEL